jgi:8-oxo-dGTP pyrophosphatase MutT (NUDIX family)
MDYEELLSIALADGRQCLVGALILNDRGKVFIHRRSPDRPLLPNCWDIVGGHVEEGESILTALRREISEETGWQLVGKPQLVRVTDWEATARIYREFDFLVDVSGDLNRPELEYPNHVEFRWIGSDDLPILNENEGKDNGMACMLVQLALRSATPNQPTFPHSMIFLPVDEIDRERARWDPAMASQIGAHVSVIYPSEVPHIEDLQRRVADAATVVPPFRLRLGSLKHFAGPENGVFVAVEDVDGGWAAIRKRAIGSELALEVEPHVTIVHPRTSNLGRAAWNAIQARSFATEMNVVSVTVTAFDGRRWPILATFRLRS